MAFQEGIIDHSIVRYARIAGGALNIYTARGQEQVDEFLRKVEAAAADLNDLGHRLNVVTGFHGNDNGTFGNFFNQEEMEQVLAAANNFENAFLYVYSNQLEQHEPNIGHWLQGNQQDNHAQQINDIVNQANNQQGIQYSVFYTWCDSNTVINHIPHYNADNYALMGSYTADEPAN